MKLSVISPTLNEAENVPALVEQLERALNDIDYEILIVDDNSADGTWSVAQKIAETNPRVRAIRRTQDPGLGPAVIDGFSDAKGDVLACIDADLQHDPAILPKMLEELQNGADVVVGSRHVDGGSTGQWDRFRRFQSWIATRTAQLLLGIRLKDPMSGYFLLSRENFLEMKDSLNGKGFKILLEILAGLGTSKIKEVPYTFRLRYRGESKLSSRVIFQYLQQVWRLCSSSRHHSIRFLKSAVVGSIGVLINLAVLALLLKFTKINNWRASAIACLAANVQNYLLHSAWSYVTDARKDFRKLEGYFSYLLMSAAGLVVTTVSYAGLEWSLGRTASMSHAAAPALFLLRLSCQFAAIVLGIRFNHVLNKMFDWPDLARLNLEAPQKSPLFVETPSLFKTVK
jgi:dolichol-phosphate mannosyltransferase